MPSQLEQVTLAIRGIGVDCAKVSGAIHQMGSELDKKADEVRRLIGGTTSAIDERMIGSIQTAAKALKDAANALVDVTSNAAKFNA